MTHGTASSYNAGCRCDECKIYNRLRKQEQRCARHPMTLCPFCEKSFRASYFDHETKCARQYREQVVR